MKKYAVEFDEESHKYFIDEVEYPSVTQILQPLCVEQARNANPYLAQVAREIGTEVHEATEMWDYFHEVPDDLSVQAEPYVMAYIQFTRDYAPKWDNIEYRMGNPELGYCGTADRISQSFMDGCVLDIKTSAKIHPLLVSAQCYAYHRLYAAEKGLTGFPKYLALQLLRDGKYRLYDLSGAHGEQAFNACMEIRKLEETNKGRRFAVK